MIKNEIKSKHEGEIRDVYVEPDVWTTHVVIDDAHTEEVNGKKFTSYRLKIVTTYPQYGGTNFQVR
jgi:hypothetical protein